MIQFIEIAASFTETFIGLWFPAKILENQRISWRKNGIATVMLTVLVWILNQYVLFSVLTSVLGILLLSTGASSIYRIKYLNVLPIVGFYMILIYACDFLCLSFLGVILHMPEFAVYAVSGLSYQRSLFLLISKIMLAFASIYLAKIFFIHGSKRYFIILFYFGEMVVLFYMVKRTLFSADLDIFLLWLSLFLLIVVGIYSVVQRSLVLAEKEESLIEKEKNKMLLEDYKLFMDIHEHNRIFYHDLKNQFLVIKSYLEQKEYRRAERYVDNIQDFGQHVEIVAYTGNEILDLMLSHKINTARTHGINVSVTSERVLLQLTEPEIAALMANVLDNAIEACHNVEDNKKWIEIVIRQIKDISFIKISNSYCEEPQILNNAFISKKKEKNLHGIGLTSVKMIAKKYNGEIDANYGKGVFTITISFFN